MMMYYRPGQPNWEFTMLKFQDFSATLILCEINFGHFEAPKTAILIDHLSSFEFHILWEFFTFSCVKFF